jgi:ribosomal protein S18 acetylase RimI-like enzyme
VWGESTFSADTYRRLRASPLYEHELDIVLECEGELVSYCTCWVDAANRIGYFEPVGTRPSHTGRGFGSAVIVEGLRRMREWGMTVASVGTASVNDAAASLYLNAGFHLAGLEHFWVKRVR